MIDRLINERELSKLRWRCRRGLLENDLFIERFFRRFDTRLTLRQGEALGVLMDLGDNDLLDLHLSRKTLSQINPDLNRADVVEVLSMLKETAERPKNEAS
ncbi:succinate dehydrogenase assembly factor 2 [Rhodoferax sp.]|uniref:FAD assembly factor SdhE n=1 Tax=Rhodoferax sp. TaxID=50421 RepID=UPI0027501022|nr:succinate dehydrogenase assembly factor 2 [Rhodoferax sp.]